MLFNGRSEQRILAWREFRNSLQSWPDDLHRVADAWRLAPTIGNYLTFDRTDNWPDAWQLMNDNMFCDVGLALGMFYTLYYSSYPHKDSLQLQGIRLQKSHKDINLVICEGGLYVLNYDIGKVVNILAIPQDGIVNYKLTPADLIR